MAAPAVSLFPLPLEPFEWYMLEDDSDRFPMTGTVTVDISGRLDHQAFVDSVNDALARHPLFTAVVERRGILCPRWVPGSQSPDITFIDSYRTQFSEADDDGSPPSSTGERLYEAPPVSHIDLTQRPGLQMTVYQEDDRAAVCFHFHHSTADGLGCHCFIGDVFAFYGQRTSYGDPPEIKPLDLSLLPRRAHLSPEVKAVMRTRKYWRRVAAGTFNYLGRPPAPLAAADVAGGARPQSGIAAQSRSIPPERLRKLRRFLHEHKITLNDLLLCELFRSLRDWNAAHGGSGDELLRVVIPSNLRGSDKARLPAACVIHFMFLAFPRSHVGDTTDFVVKVASEMRKRVEVHSGSVYHWISKAASYIPGALPLFVKHSTGSGTAVGSFIGDPSRSYAAKFPREQGRCVAGNVRIERFSLRGTVRAGTFLNLSSSVYADRLSLNVTVDERHCGPGAAAHFADDLRERVLATACRP